MFLVFLAMSTITTTNGQTISLESLQGTRDFLPDEMLLQNYLFNMWHTVSRQFGFKQYDAPIVEPANLWDKKSGSDILNEMYVFEKDGVQMCLRPEMTPSVTRMIIKQRKSLILPARWYSIPQCWRYESTTRGRKREFYQWNMDIFGALPIRSEVELFNCIVIFLQRLRLTSKDVIIRVSDRRILQCLFDKFGLPVDKFNTACNLVDKIAKLERHELTKMFTEQVGFTAEQIEQIYQLVKIDSIPMLEGFFTGLDIIKSTTVEGELPWLTEMKTVFETMRTLGLGEWFKLDVSIVRGLAYYTGIIFEGYFTNSELKRAILGGGRYDSLMATYGAEPLPAIGFGMGDVVIMDVLNELDLLPTLTHNINYMIFPFNDSLFADATSIAHKMRQLTKYNVEVYMGKNRMKNALDYANRAQIQNVIIIAPDEWSKGMITIKPMFSTNPTQQKGEQKTMTVDQFIDELLRPVPVPLYLTQNDYNTGFGPESAMGMSDSDGASYGTGA